MEAALRELASTATRDALRTAVLTFVDTLRDRGVDEGLIAGTFYTLCSALGLPDE
jgi:hypothetical protein